MRIVIIVLWITFFCVACEGVDEVLTTPTDDFDDCTNHVINTGKYYEKDDKAYLYGGNDSSTHFNITGWSLSKCNLGNGLGRESFEALVEPAYVSLTETGRQYPDDSEAVLLISEKSVKVFPLGLLYEHELVNEMADGNPVMVVFCPLADLVSVYSRIYCDDTLTFGVSGFTYKDSHLDELESFILWDRDTESLWWPINNQGVAGAFQDSALKKYNNSKWGRATIGSIKDRYPNAMVLKAGQSFDERNYSTKEISCATKF